MKLIKVPSCTFSKCPLVHECHRCKKNLTENRQLFSPLRVGNQGFYTTISDQSLNWLLGPMAPAPWDASSPNAMLHVLSAAEDSTDTEKGADWDVESGQNKQSGMRYHIYICIFAYIYMIILGYNQITLHNLKQDYLNLEPPAVLYISISAGHVFMVIWRGRLEGLLNSDQPWFNPLAWGRGKTTGTSQCNSLGIKFHKLIHVPVYNPFFLRGKWRCFSHWSSEKKQDLASGHQTPEQGFLRNAFDWRCEGCFEHQPPVVSDVIWKKMWIFMVQNHRKWRVQQQTVGDLTIKRWLCQLIGAVSQC